MRTKHVLMAMLLPTVFAACTQEDYAEVQNIKNDSNRPVVDNVTFTLGESNSLSRVWDPDGKFGWTENIGAALMDQPTGTGTTFADKYALSNYVNTDYPFAYDETLNAWSTTGMLLEGNYFFYYPRKEAGKARQNFTWSIPVEQDAFVGETHKRYAALKDQMWISYKGIEANTNMEDTTLNINLAPAFAEVSLRVQYEGESNMEIRKVVITPNNSAKFPVAGTLDIETVTGGEDYGFVGVDTLEEASKLPAIFNIYNQVPQDSTKIAKKNPLQQGAFLKKVTEAPSISVNFKNQKLTNGKYTDATILMPNHINKDYGYSVTIYTDKGVVEYDQLKADTIVTVKDEETYKAATIYENNKKNEFGNVLDSITVQGGTGVILTFMDKAVTVEKTITVNSTEELDMYMSYYDFQNYEEETDITITLGADSIFLSKEAYNVLKADENIKVNLNGSNRLKKNLYLGSDLSDDAINLIDATSSYTGFNIVEGASQKLTVAGVKNIINNGTLTIERAKVGENTPSAEVTVLKNLGILNVKTPLTSTSLTNGVDNVAPAATMTLDAAVSTSSVSNYATMTVNANQSWTYQGLTASVTTGSGQSAQTTTYKPTLTIASDKSFGNTSSTNDGDITNNGTLVIGENSGKIINNYSTKVTTNNDTIVNNVSVLENGAPLVVTTNGATGVITTVADSQTDILTANNGKIYWVEDAFINGLENVTGSHTEIGNVIYQVNSAMTASELYSKIANVPVSAIEVAAKLTVDKDPENLKQLKAITMMGAEIVANDTVYLSNCPIYVYGTGNKISGTTPVVFMPAGSSTEYCKIEVAEGAVLETTTIIAGLAKVNVANNAKVVARTKVYVNTADAVILTPKDGKKAAGQWLGTKEEVKTISDLAAELGLTN